MFVADNLVVKFKHENNQQTMQGTTRCRVLKKNADNAWEQVSEGVSHTHYTDQYCKRIGRRVTLARAVQDLSKEERTTIWNGYHAKTADLN